MAIISSQPKDIEQNIIQGSISGLPFIDNFTVASGSWNAITLRTSDCKKIILKPRDQADWRMATTSGGNYFTFLGGAALVAPVSTTSGNIICWVYAMTNTTLELLTGT